MSKSTPALAIGAALTLSITAAQAQYLYVPLTNYPGDGTVVELVATNTDATLVRFLSGQILAEGSDGTIDPGTPTGPFAVAPGATQVIKGPPGIGLWRIEGYEGLQISARQRVPTVAPSHEGVAVPILSSETVHPAGSTVVVQSLIAAEGYLSDFGLFNGGGQGARCEAGVFLADGTQVGSTFTLHVAPLSFLFFENVPTAIVAGVSVSDVHVSMSCDQDFFALSRTVNPETGYISIHTPSSAISDGLPPPGSSPEPPPPPPPPPPSSNPSPPPPDNNPPPPAGQAARFSRSGQFFTPTNGNPVFNTTMPVPANVTYSLFKVSFDVKHGGWYKSQPDGIHNVVYITRGGWSGDVFALITARGPNRNLVRNEITVDLAKQQISQKQVSAHLQPGTTYRVDYTYNHKGRKWEVKITGGGAVVANFSGPTTGPIWTKNGVWRIILSDNPVAAHVPSIGWQYSNLLVEWIP